MHPPPRFPARITSATTLLLWGGLLLPPSVPAATASVDLGQTDSERGLRNSQRGDGTDGENDAGTCGSQGDLRSGRTNRGSGDDDFPDAYAYFLVEDAAVKGSTRIEIRAAFFDDPAFGTDPVTVRLDYTNARSTGPDDIPDTFSRHPRAWRLSGTGRWVRHAWSIRDAGLRTFMQGTSDFRFDFGGGRVCVSRVEVTGVPDPPPPDEPLVGAHYYPWYFPTRWNYGECVSGALRLELRPAESPALGRYDSSSPTVVDQHLRWCSEHGVNVIILEFIDPGGREDRNCREVIFSHPRSADVSFAVMYDWAIRFGGNLSITGDRIETAASDFRYLAREYFQRPTYLRRQGRPLAMIYVTRALSGDVEGLIGAIRDACAQDGSDVFLAGDEFFFPSAPSASKLARWDGIFGYDCYAGRGGYWGSNGTLDLFQRRTDDYRSAATGSGAKFFPSILPGFNDRAIRRTCADNPALARQLTPGSSDTSLFQELLVNLALPRLDDELPLVAITSFNEWHEDTEIEPTKGTSAPTDADSSPTGSAYTQGIEYVDFGTGFLDVIRDAVVAVSGRVLGPRGLVPGARIEVIDRGAAVLERRSFTTGFYTVPRLRLRSGASYRLRATADGLGVVLSPSFTVSASATVTDFDLVFPDQPPEVRITSPPDGSTFVAPADLSIEATATDDGAVERVEFFAGSTLLATDPSPPYRFVWRGAPPGTHTIRARAIDAAGGSSEDSVTVTVIVGGEFIRGDSNADGVTDISDAVSTLGVLFLGAGTLSCEAAADVNDDDSVDISDAIATLSYLFLGGSSPPAPGPTSCGRDLTPGRLGCAAHPPCDG